MRSGIPKGWVIHGKALDFAAEAAAWKITWDKKTRATAGKEMLRRISAMVAEFYTDSGNTLTGTEVARRFCQKRGASIRRVN
jgi:hypothetical protein